MAEAKETSMNENVSSGATRGTGTQVSDRPRVVDSLGAVGPVESGRGEMAARSESMSVHVEANDRRDQVRWGPVWAGVITALPVFLLLEMVFFSFGWLTLGGPNPGATSVYLMTGLAGVISFFIGGMVAAATAMWKGLNAGLVQGMLVWALSMTTILVLSLLGAGALFGAFSQVLGQISAIQNAVNQGGVPIGAAALNDARAAAGWAVLSLLVLLTSSILGGIAGAKMWPRDGQMKSGAGS